MGHGASMEHYASSSAVQVVVDPYGDPQDCCMQKGIMPSPGVVDGVDQVMHVPDVSEARFLAGSDFTDIVSTVKDALRYHVQDCGCGYAPCGGSGWGCPGAYCCYNPKAKNGTALVAELSAKYTQYKFDYKA